MTTMRPSSRQPPPPSARDRRPRPPPPRRRRPHRRWRRSSTTRVFRRLLPLPTIRVPTPRTCPFGFPRFGANLAPKRRSQDNTSRRPIT
ncbi:unnamed protein product [Oppiella nova]|uniref:Uncharacterized protein n=1 Tax=Oppiella nova TaxID=334625 RepID=A0A7R9MRM7_9ACAR|nr:unnamed protein product [Oppiella nova]CAG2181129.1 unnamed protein product [Oppiella nova]